MPTHNPEVTSNAIIIAPSASNTVTITPSGSSWGNSAWVQVLAANAESSAMVFLGCALSPAIAIEFELEIGTGGAGAETAIGIFRGYCTVATGASPSMMWLPIPIDNAAANSRIAVRLRKSGTSVVTWFCALAYYRKPIAGQVTVTANASQSYPAAADNVSLTPSGSAWANSSWVQLTASTSTAIILGAIIFKPAVAVEFEIDIGTGGSGSEVVVTTKRGVVFSTSGGFSVLNLRLPLDNIATSTRVAIRMRKAGASTVAWTFSVLYYAKPL